MRPLPQALPPGTELGNYELRKVLGQGSGGFAYLCRDSLLERDVVLKEHFPQGLCRRTPEGEVEAAEGAEDTFEQSLNLFLQEARTLAGLRHNGIVRIWDVIPSHGTALAVMEPVSGDTLDVYLLRHTDDTSALDRLLRRLLEILAFLHAHGVIHRDIKPANIVVQADEQPVLLDFGAALRGERNGAHTIVGTPGYAAPEQFDTQSELGPWCDLYALAQSFILALGAERVSRLPRRLRRSLYRAARQDAPRRFRSAEAWQRALRPSRLPPIAAGGMALSAAAALLYAAIPTAAPETPAQPPEARPPLAVSAKSDTSPPEAREEALRRLSDHFPVDIPVFVNGMTLIINAEELAAVQVDADLADWESLPFDTLVTRLQACLAAGRNGRAEIPFAPQEHLFPEPAEQAENQPTYRAILFEQCALVTLPCKDGSRQVCLLCFDTSYSGQLAAISDGGAHVLTRIPFRLVSHGAPNSTDEPRQTP